MISCVLRMGDVNSYQPVTKNTGHKGRTASGSKYKAFGVEVVQRIVGISLFLKFLRWATFETFLYL